MEYIAIKGRPAAANDDYVVYFCETYSVAIWTRGTAYFMLQAIETGGFCEKHALLQSLFLLKLTKKWFRDLKYKLSPKEILEQMKDKGLLFYGQGDSRRQAINQILDQSAFIPTIRTGTKDAEVVAENQEYYKALLKPEYLTPLEKEVLSWITSRDALLRKHPLRMLQNPEIAKKGYASMETLTASEVFSGCTKDMLYDAVAGLYSKHCIVLADRDPRITYSKTDDPDKIVSYEIFA